MNIMGLYDQFQRPTGRQGRIVAARMNLGHKALTTWGLSYVTIDPNSVVLDAGCGGGKTINRLAKRVPHGKVYGIDYSHDMVEYAKKLNQKYIEQGKVEIVEGQVDKTGFSSGFFDLVTAIETYYFWYSLPDAFREIKRILKPNGKLLMVNEMVKDGVHDVKQAELIEKTHVHLFPLEEIKGMLQQAWFVGVEISRKKQSPWNTIIAQKPTI
jgi:ubiquinone/menaquinone biosynthesis C-methylase UbiE